MPAVRIVRPIGPPAVEPRAVHGGSAGQRRQFAGVGLDGSPRSDLEPYWSAQTTWGFDAHFGRPAMRSGVSVHPLARERLSASPPRSLVAHGALGP